VDVDGPVVNADILSAGPADQPPRRSHRLVGVMICVAVVLTIAGGEADRVLRHREFSALLGATVGAQATAEHADARMLSTRRYTMPLLTSAPIDVRKGLAQVIANSAATGVIELRSERAAVASTFVLPWHSAMRKAKSADLRYLDAWTAYLDGVAHGGDIGAVATQTLEDSRVSAIAALRAAAPDHTAARAVPSPS
jgi:hypothetical protein